MKMIIAKILIWFIGKLHISVMIGVEIDTQRQYCKAKWYPGITGFSDLNGVGFLGWDMSFFCKAENTYIGFDARKERDSIDEENTTVMGIVMPDVKNKPIIIKNLTLENIGKEEDIE